MKRAMLRAHYLDFGFGVGVLDAGEVVAAAKYVAHLVEKLRLGFLFGHL